MYDEELDEQRQEQRQEEKREQEQWEEDVALYAYWEYYWSPEGWIDRFYDAFIKEYDNQDKKVPL